MSASTSTSTAAAAARKSPGNAAAARRLCPALLLLLGALLPARASAQAAASGCPISMTFYPPGTTNLPSAWSKANQTAAGNSRDDALLPIALYGIPTPELNAAALSPVLGAPGTIVPAACSASGAAAITRRRALQQVAAAGGALATPASYSFAWSLDGRAPVLGQGGPAVNASGALIFPKISLTGASDVWALKDGAHTLTLTMVVEAGSGSLADGTRVPATQLKVERTVVFHKMLERPTAKVAFNTCTPAFGVQMTNMSDAVPLVDTNGQLVPAADGTGGAAAFLRPVYHVWGRFQSGLNGEAFAGEDSEHSSEWHFFDRYFVRELGAPSTLQFDKADLVQGYYELSVEGSVVSDYPSLVALAGADKFGQEGTVYSSVGNDGLMTDTDLAGKDKFNGAFVAGLNGTRVGVQKGKTGLLAFAGPGAPPAVGETIDLTWAFQGLGNTTCTLDGVTRGNSPAVPSPPGACVSPYKVTVADNLNHTLAVSFRDVCGATRTETLVYGAGREWSTTAELDALAMVDSALALQDPMLSAAQGGGEGRVLGRARNGAAAAAASLLGGGGVKAALAAAALLLAL